MPAPNVERPITPDREKWEEVWEKMNEGELLYARLAEKVGGMADAQNEIKTDVRELRKQMNAHETLHAQRATARETSEREMRGEISALRESTAKGFEAVDSRLDDLGAKMAVLIDRQPTPETPPPPGPITAALGIPPRQPARVGTAATVTGGVTLASVLGGVAALAGLPLPVQWMLGVCACLAMLTVCVVVGVRMTRRD